MLMDPFAASGLVLSLLCIASPLHKHIRQLAKPFLVNVTIKQLPWVAAAQIYSNRLLDVAVLLSAATITLEVYLTLIPVLIWSGKAHVVVTGLLPQLALSGYVVFAIKDLLESPRPGDCLKAAPEVHINVRDPSGDIEDGVPSAHCCGAVSLLYYAIHAATAAGLLSAHQQSLAQAAAAVWVLWLAWGRAYLGLHSPLDLATGSVLGWVLLRLWLHVEGPYAAWLEATARAQPWQLPLQVLLFSAVLMRCYPMPSRWTSCYTYATAWAAGWAGATVGWGLLQQVESAAVASAAAGLGGHVEPWLFGGLVPPTACKVFLGLGLVAATKVVVKALLLAVFRPLFACVPLTVRCCWQPPVVGAVRQTARQQQQQQPQRLAGYASAVLADMAQGAGAAAAANTTDKLSVSAGSAGPRAGVGSAAQPTSGPSSQSSTSSSSKVAGVRWSLRHSPEGVGNDVVAAARWCSYFAVGFVILLWHGCWPHVLHWLSPAVAAA